MSQDSPERKITELDEAASGRPLSAWQPLTLRGVAAFGHASGSRLLVVQLLTSLLISLAVFHLASRAVLPALRQAIESLPDEGRIQNQALDMVYPSTEPLVEGRVLGFVIDLDNQSEDILASDFKIELHRRDWQVCSLPGCVTLDYPAGWIIELNRLEAASNLEAWKPTLVVLVVLGPIMIFLLAWRLLAALYAVVPWIMAFYSNRNLRLAGAFRLACAVQLPGGLLLALAVFFYGMEWIDLFRLTILVVLHLPLTWFYLFASPFFLPRLEGFQTGAVAFGHPPAMPDPPEPPPAPETKPAPSAGPNPFAPASHPHPNPFAARPDGADEN